MRKIVDFLFSSRLMALILILFAIAIATATFIENDFGNASARSLVYNARWFELLLLIGAVNLLGMTIKKKLYQWKKLTLFLFHLSFILILLGAAITRYTGFEGTMSIREGQSNDLIITDKTYIRVRAEAVSGEKEFRFPVLFSVLGKNRLNKHIHVHGKQYTFRVKEFIPNAIPVVEPDAAGVPVAELVYLDAGGRKSLVIRKGETKKTESVVFLFGTTDGDSSGIQLINHGDSLFFMAPFEVSQTNMADQQVLSLAKNSVHHFYPKRLYNFRDNLMVLNTFYGHAGIAAKSASESNSQSGDALIAELAADHLQKEFILWGKRGIPGEPEKLIMDSTKFIISYGSIFKKIPFKVTLNDFIVERYPGSMSPSSFESKVQLENGHGGIIASKRIYMNNVLKYKGFRFYQSSYTSDEKSTILSVNHDWAGTFVTYAGYLLMGIGMMLSLFNRNSHFRKLASENTMIKHMKKGLSAIVFLLLLQPVAFTQPAGMPGKLSAVDPSHARHFGQLLVQDNGGRIKPLNSLSDEVLRKLYRKSTYKGQSADQVFTGMLIDPETWQKEPIIRATHPQIQEILGNQGKYYSFLSFFKDNNYILHQYVENAYQKDPALRSKFDNEIIRLDERVNICYLVLTGELMRLFPKPGDSTRTWYSPQAIRGQIRSEDSVFTDNIIPLYIQEARQSLRTGSWNKPDDIVNAIAKFQHQFAGDILPPAKKIRMEIFLNKSDIFARISNFYGLIGFVLLLLQLVNLFYPRLNLKIPVFMSIVLIGALFIFHSTGLALRWYVSGHAPWSNGYEALIYIAWATVLAGLIFVSRSSMALSATALLAFLILHTAHLSWMDPQITNLVPVLKSYWLVIHVATITASYGFFALGAILAGINLILMIMQTRKNYSYIDLTIRELTNVIEMTLVVGLYLMAIGTFLGGVWANESWGRYWGWDPKETWALVTVLLYAFIMHMRMVPGLKGLYPFNLASLLGFGSVIMTYFGVNYYLSGLHSYAKGDPFPVPVFVYYTLAVTFVIGLLAFINYRRMYSMDSVMDEHKKP
jgi:cytochrome c-type biogenesis protein CcsB